MGRGRSKLSGTERMARIKQLKTDLSAAKRSETKLKNDYAKKAGAVLAFDWHSRNEAEARAAYDKALTARNKAEARYNEAISKREGIEKQINKLAPKRSALMW